MGLVALRGGIEEMAVYSGENIRAAPLFWLLALALPVVPSCVWGGMMSLLGLDAVRHGSTERAGMAGKTNIADIVMPVILHFL